MSQRKLGEHVGEAQQAEPGAVGRPDLAPGEAERGGEDGIPAVLPISSQDPKDF